MAEKLLTWTALPNGIRRRDAGAPWTVHLSVFLTPRLGETGADQTLADFPEFVDWPTTLAALDPAGLAFNVHTDTGAGGVQRLTTAATSAPDSTTWRAIFSPDLAVSPDTGGALKSSAETALAHYDTRGVTTQLRDIYTARLAADLGATESSPSLDSFRIDRRELSAPTTINDNNPIAQFARFFHAADGNARRTADDDRPDFHRVIATLSSHPLLLRRLGLVFDLAIPVTTLTPDRVDGLQRIRIEPANAEFPDCRHVSLWTAVEVGANSRADYREFRAADRDQSAPAGLPMLGSDQLTVVQENLEHGAFSLMQYANNNGAAKPDSDRPLPALLQGGMRVAHADKITLLERALREQSRLTGALSTFKADSNSNADIETLHAEQLTRGYRVDVEADGDGHWRSLCRRVVSYSAADWSWPAAGNTLDDEGTVEPSVYEDARVLTPEPRSSEELFEWDGWSLVVGRPDADTQTTQPSLADQGTTLLSHYRVKPGSLTPQRFGRCYRFRLRPVDIAGNSLSVIAADALGEDANAVQITPSARCLRVESAKPPIAVRAQARGPGEAGDVVVLRDADEPKFRTESFAVHVAPPETTLPIAEKHGVFDALSDSDAWALLATHQETPGMDAAGKPLEMIDAPEFYTRYLPDPLVRQAVIVLPDGAGTVATPRFDDIAPTARNELARSFRLNVRKGRDGISAQVKGRTVDIAVPPGRVQIVGLAALLSAEDAELLAFANAEWCGADKTAPAKALAAATAAGQAPVVAPLRELKFIYATQRPLMAPQFGRAQILPRARNDTSAVLADDALVFDRPSTGRIDVYARWEDLRDDPADPGWTTVGGDLHVGGTDIDETDGKPLDLSAEGSNSPLQHDFRDTRHRLVAYTAVATSRFLEFYPSAVTDDSDNITLASKETLLRIPATAPPAAPDIAYVVPTFSTPSIGPRLTRRERTIERRGNGLRIYLERGWFSSGAGEQLALVLPAANAKRTPSQVSEWGLNPLRDSAPLPGPLASEHVWGGAARQQHVDVADGAVDLVLFDVQFSTEHQLPFVDIEFISQRAFMPLTRLALARYQPHAVDDCHMSPIVQADFVPLAPGRALTVKRTHLDTLSLTVRGYSFDGSRDAQSTMGSSIKTSVMVAHVECLPANQPADAANWLPLGTPVELEPERVAAYRYHWRGTVRIDDDEYLSPRWRRRLIVQEFEPFATATAPQPALPDRSRLLSAHSIEL